MALEMAMYRAYHRWNWQTETTPLAEPSHGTSDEQVAAIVPSWSMAPIRSGVNLQQLAMRPFDCEAAQPGRSIIDGVHPIPENNLLSRALEFLQREPMQMGTAPMLAAAEDPAAPEQKGQQLLTLAA